MKSIYTIPKVTKYGDPKKSWFVFFRYDGKLFRFKKGINYIENLKKREIEANALRDALYQKLKEGWNPLIPDIEALNPDMGIIEALTFALDKKKETLAEKTIIAYTSAFNFFCAATNTLKLDRLQISEVRRIHVKLIFEQIKKDRKWSNKSYNKNLGFMKSIFSELLQWDKIENNPAHNIKALKVEIEESNIVATDEQMILIKDHILDKFPNFYNYFVTIFHTGIRPNEILNLKVHMVNLEKSVIKIPAAGTKTDIFRVVPVNKFMSEYLSIMIDDSTPQDHYLFGSNRLNSNRGLKNDLDFTPGPRKLNRDAASKLWRKLVKNDLNIDINMYSMKHLGANKKISAGIDLDTLRELYGHTSKMMTKRYAKNVTDVYRKQIMDMSPDY